MRIAFAIAALAVFALPASAASPEYCKHYADLALWQYHKSQTIPNCYQGDTAVWSPNFEHHYQWCLGVPERQARAGDKTRGERLHQCNMSAYGHP
jgi:hypothetical protein